MDPKFASAVESLHPLFERLTKMVPVKAGNMPSGMPSSGVYLFSEGQKHLYVGRTNRLRHRYGEHCRPSSSHFQAPFAFLLARKATRNVKAAYASGPKSRKGLSTDPLFLSFFTRAKERIRRMHFRFVEEPDQMRQTLLELYCAIALGTPYNDFRTH